MAKAHKYLGNGKEKKFPNGGTVVNGSICLDDFLNMKELKDRGIALGDLLAIPENVIDISAKNGKHYMPITISERPQPSKWGDTHGIYIEEYYMNRQPKAPVSASASGAPAPADDDDDDVPW